MQLMINQKINHKTFGKGIIIDVDNKTISVRFGNTIKLFLKTKCFDYIEVLSLAPGLYTKNDVLVMSWEEIESTYPDAFNEDKTSIKSDANNYSCFGKLSGKLTIPSSVTNSGSGAFYNCKLLTNITIPGSVTSIGDCVFEDCISLTSVTIPDSVTNISAGAFYNCKSLTSITIPDSVTSIENRAFYNCKSLKRINYKGTKKQWSEIQINNSAFEHCEALNICCSDGIFRIPKT